MFHMRYISPATANVEIFPPKPPPLSLTSPRASTVQSDSTEPARAPSIPAMPIASQQHALAASQQNYGHYVAPRFDPS